VLLYGIVHYIVISYKYEKTHTFAQYVVFSRNMVFNKIGVKLTGSK